MKHLFIPFIFFLLTISGCANTQLTGDLGVDLRAAIHAKAIAHAKETIREAREWETLAKEASAVQTAAGK